MSDGLKTGLILAGAGLVAFYLYERSRAQAAGLTTTTPGGMPSATAAAPGVGSAPVGAGSPATSTAAAPTSSSHSQLKTIAKLAAAPVYYPTKAVVAGATYAYDKLTSIL